MEPVAKPDNSDVGGEFLPTPPSSSVATGNSTESGMAAVGALADAGGGPGTPEGAPPLAGEPEFYSGLWNDIPLFKCPYCSYTALSTHGGPGAIEIHILTQIERGSPGHQAALTLKEE